MASRALSPTRVPLGGSFREVGARVLAEAQSLLAKFPSSLVVEWGGLSFFRDEARQGAGDDRRTARRFAIYNSRWCFESGLETGVEAL